MYEQNYDHQQAMQNEGQPLLMNIHDLQASGIPRNIAYQLLNRADMPVVCFGRRKFMVRDKFMRWLDENSSTMAAIK